MLNKLSENELAIMMKIWELEQPIYFNDIVEAVSEYNWAESTVRNFLVRIIDKKYLEIEKEGRKNIYVPRVSKDYINTKSKGLIKDLYNNSIKNFIAEMYESQSIEYEDLIELKKYLDSKIESE
ncbi:MAG: BlaI/MecI/CopY family transcriptional regulator [Tissierellia bacterium]|nr:BlaI/MecI/CopY family transcriptional regulator [Tissierellia bacterium]